jgi:hypothetical protein
VHDRNKETRMRLVDKTIANCKEVVEATESRATSKEKMAGVTITDNDLEKQRLYVESSLARCRRCGDHTPTFLPTAPLALICADCEATLRATDKCMWFAELISKISTKEGEKE